MDRHAMMTFRLSAVSVEYLLFPVISKLILLSSAVSKIGKSGSKVICPQLQALSYCCVRPGSARQDCGWDALSEMCLAGTQFQTTLVAECFFFSLSWVANTQLNQWTNHGKRMVRI